MRHYIAIGGETCKLIVEKDFKKAGEILTKGQNGTIIAFNPLEDNLEGLVQVTSGFETMVLSAEELDELMKFVQLDRPIYTVDYKSIPYERMTNFFTEASIKELTSKQILKCN